MSRLARAIQAPCLTLLLVVIALAGCAGGSALQMLAPVSEPASPPPPTAEQLDAGLLEGWSNPGLPVTRILIDTDAQLARFYHVDVQIGWSRVATGTSNNPTPVGQFAILEKDANKRSNLYGRIIDADGEILMRDATSEDPVPPGARFVGARMPHFMRLTFDGIGMHAGPIPRPGLPASHGCIRIPAETARIAFARTDLGVPVTLRGPGPDYGNYVAQLERLGQLPSSCLDP